MSQSLSAKSESFFAYVTAVLFIANDIYPLVRVRISFVFVFIVTKITVEPDTTFVLLYMYVEIACIFETFITIFFIHFSEAYVRCVILC